VRTSDVTRPVQLMIGLAASRIAMADDPRITNCFQWPDRELFGLTYVPVFYGRPCTHDFSFGESMRPLA